MSTFILFSQFKVRLLKESIVFNHLHDFYISCTPYPVLLNLFSSVQLSESYIYQNWWYDYEVICKAKSYKSFFSFYYPQQFLKNTISITFYSYPKSSLSSFIKINLHRSKNKRSLLFLLSPSFGWTFRNLSFYPLMNFILWTHERIFKFELNCVFHVIWWFSSWHLLLIFYFV